MKEDGKETKSTDASGPESGTGQKQVGSRGDSTVMTAVRMMQTSPGSEDDTAMMTVTNSTVGKSRPESGIMNSSRSSMVHPQDIEDTKMDVTVSHAQDTAMSTSCEAYPVAHGERNVSGIDPSGEKPTSKLHEGMSRDDASSRPCKQDTAGMRESGDENLSETTPTDSAATGSRQQDSKRTLQLPRVNCPEKIVLCLDLSEEMAGHPFRVSDGSRYPAVSMVRRTVELFINNKHEIDKRHEFALVVLHGSAMWVKNFTREPKDIFAVLDDLETEPSDNCNLFSLFDLIVEKVQLPKITNVESVPPPYVVRAVLIYGRSMVMPHIDDIVGSLTKLQQSPYFFLDVLYLHDVPSSENKCEEIFNRFCEMDRNGTSYIFQVGRNPTKLLNSMAKLLAHPLQRPLQSDLFYRLELTDD